MHGVVAGYFKIEIAALMYLSGRFTDMVVDCEQQ